MQIHTDNPHLSKEVQEYVENIYRNNPTDPLTGLLELDSFRSAIRDVLTRRAVNPSETALVYFNVTAFKSYNEKHGYDEGNQLLLKISRAIMDACPFRIATRYTGDHFAIFLFDEEIDTALSGVFTATDALFTGTSSLLKAGICSYSEKTADVRLLMDHAKAAADSIRNSPDQRVRFYDDDLDRQIKKRQYIIDHIDEACRKGWIETWYQPVVRTLVHTICGMEALARWRDPVYGLMNPGEFVPVLEDAHLIHKLDLCMLHTLCRDLSRIRQKEGDIIPISFNLSRLDFEAVDVHREILDTLAHYELPRDLVHVEITESVLGRSGDMIRREIDQFHQEGFEVWMDDFGSGYSSLNSLQKYDFDTLKIDMMFLRNTNKKTPLILASIVDMAKRLGIHTLAEGVETREQFEFLHSIGCEKIQGYYISKPLPIDELEKIVRAKGYGQESAGERLFRDKLGKVNFLSNTPLAFSRSRNSGEDFAPAVGLVVYENQRFHFLNINSSMKQLMEKAGFAVDADGFGTCTEADPSVAAKVRRAAAQVNAGEPVNLDITHDKSMIRFHAEFVARTDQKVAFILTAADISGSINDDNFRLQDISHTMMSLAMLVSIIDLGFNAVHHLYEADIPSQYHDMRLSELVPSFAQNEIHPEDRTHFLDLLNVNSLPGRLNDSPSGALEGYFRVRSVQSGWMWCHLLLTWQDQSRQEVLCIMRRTDSRLTGGYMARISRDLNGESYENSINDHLSSKDAGLLLTSFMNLTESGFFWKDKSRRYLGANNVFLNYYGLSSPSEILGKTDEEMGWHVDLGTNEEDDARVLNEGISTKDVPESVVVKGEMRKILVSKVPIFRNGQIIGLAARLRDITQEVTQKEKAEQIARTDEVTGLLNTVGLVHAYADFYNAFSTSQKDFAFTNIEISHFRAFTQQFGTEAGIQVMKTVADIIRIAAEPGAVISHPGGGRFSLMQQFVDTAQIDAQAKRIRDQIRSLTHIGDIPTTFYAHSGVAYMHEADGFDQLRMLANDRLQNYQERDLAAAK